MHGGLHWWNLVGDMREIFGSQVMKGALDTLESMEFLLAFPSETQPQISSFGIFVFRVPMWFSWQPQTKQFRRAAVNRKVAAGSRLG